MTATVQYGTDQKNTSAEYNDGVKAGQYTTRWQKHGHDRIYVGDDGYVDIQSGEAVDLPNRVGEIDNIRLEKQNGEMQLLGDAHGMTGELATIPLGVWGGK